MDRSDNNLIAPIGTFTGTEGAFPAQQSPERAMHVEKSDKDKKEEADQATQALIKKWLAKINAAKKKFEPDFSRMKSNLEFVSGLQWSGQDDLNDDRYVANVTLREINQGVAALYARNPKAVARRRERLDSTVWDGKLPSLIQASQAMMQGAAIGQPNPMAQNVLLDCVQVEQQRTMLDNLGKTLEIEYQIQVDRQEPNFKLQMKQLVRRVKVAGVGYVRLSFKRTGRKIATQQGIDIPSRLAKLKSLTEDFEKKKFDDENEKYEQMKMLANSIQYTLSSEPNDAKDEKLVFDFPAATNVIVDPHCTILKGFVGAKWQAFEYIMSLEDAKAFFEMPDLSVGADAAKNYTMQGLESPTAGPNATGTTDGSHVCIWEVYSIEDRARFFVCDGYSKNWLIPPEEPTPCVQQFWPAVAITFNDVETAPDTKVSIYPPSDVDLMRSAQKEWNRCKQYLREHRKGNRPSYATSAGALEDEDKEILRGNYDSCAVITIRGLQPTQKVSDLIQPIQKVPIDTLVYSTEPMERDINFTTGSQQANLGPITNRGTATEASISEQSRMSSTSSNVDDVDDMLSSVAQIGGEMLLREMSKETVVRDVGPGAVWPEGDRLQYVERIFLEIAAASTGRPNKGLEIANFEKLAPMFLQMIPSLPPPVQGQLVAFLVQEAIKRLDDRIDAGSILPGLQSLSAGVLPGATPTPTGAQPNPSASPNNTSAGPSMPLMAQSDAASSNLG